MDPHEYSREKVPAEGSAFYYSARSLPPDRRRALIALHAFRAELRDAVDTVRDPGVARTKLTWWSQELARMFDGKAQHPVARALCEFLGPYALERPELEELVRGAAMDLEYNAYPDLEALTVYCRRNGGAFARLMAKTCGFQDPKTLEHAEALGIASELARVVRDAGEDARRGRIYLPLHEMAEHGVTSDDVMHARETDAFRRLIEFQIARANAYYDRAIRLLPDIDRRSQRPGLVAAAIDRAMLREIEADGCHVLTRKLSLTPLRMAWIAWRTR